MFPSNPAPYNSKLKVSTDILHSRLHISHELLATIKAKNLWHDVDISQCSGQLFTSRKITSIPAASMGKHCTSHVFSPLDEIQVDTIPHPESLGLSSESRYGYYLIFSRKYSRTFQLCGIWDKTTYVIFPSY